VPIRLRVLAGEVRIGILAADERSFVIEKTAHAGNDGTIEIDLPILLAGVAKKVIIRNGAGETISRAVVEEVSVWRAAS
jgi:hypothetical protein